MAEEAPAPKQFPSTIGFHYLKSPHYRTVHADGAVGGVSPRAEIDVTFYSERLAIPNYLEMSVGEDGLLGEEVKGTRTGKTGIIREVEATVIFDLAAAKTFLTWFEKHVATLEEALRDKGDRPK